MQPASYFWRALASSWRLYPSPCSTDDNEAPVTAVLASYEGGTALISDDAIKSVVRTPTRVLEKIRESRGTETQHKQEANY